MQNILGADLFLFYYERDFMMSVSDDKLTDTIDAFNTTSRYLDAILNINKIYFDNMASQIYPRDRQLDRANTSDTEASFLDLHLSISNDIVSTKFLIDMFLVLHLNEPIFFNSSGIMNFSKFYVRLKLLRQGLSEPDFYGRLISV